MNNYLYHFTTRENWWKIREDNILKVSNQWRGISFTRDKNLIKRSKFLKHHGKNMMLILDRDKLSFNYSIKPYHFFANHTNPYAVDECEEVIEKDITNLSKYLVDYKMIEVKINLRKGFGVEQYT